MKFSIINSKAHALQKAGALLCVVVLSGCAFGKDDAESGACAAEDPAITAQRDAAFGSTLHPVFAKYACNSCHDGVSGKGPYSFAASDAATAQPFARKFIDSSDPSASRFVEKVGVENHNCGANCSTAASEMQTQIAAWIAAEANLPTLACTDGGKIKVTVPSQKFIISQLTSTAKSFRFDLATADPPIAGAGFEIRAKLITPPSGLTLGAYQLSDPRLAFTGTSNYRISNIQIYVNGLLDPSSVNFLIVDFVVQPTSFVYSAVTWPFPVVSEGTQLMIVQNSAGDDLAFSFDLEHTQEVGDTNAIAVGCLAEAQFINTIRTAIFGRCTGCHSQSGNPARNSFSMAGDVDLCSQSLAKSSFSDPLNSTLILHPNNEDMLNHPNLALGVGRLSTAEKNTIKAWIDAEAAAQP